jgi:2-dehydropantoate 2-reductase
MNPHADKPKMTNENNWPKVAVVGAGAGRRYFGGLLARSGVPVTMIDARVCGSGAEDGLVSGHQAVSGDGASCGVHGTLRHGRRDYVLFCVNDGYASRSRRIYVNISPSAVVLSLQNGVNNAEEICNATGIEAISTVVYVAASSPSPGTGQHLGRGDLVIGPHSPKVDKMEEFFSRAKLPCRVSDNIEGELWTKLVWNCALNAVSGLGRVTYGEIIASEDAKRVVETVVHEVLAVAKKKRIHPPGLEDPKAAIAGAFLIGQQMSGTRSSTAQDMARGKRTEIDSLNGYIARLGAELGVGAGESVVHAGEIAGSEFLKPH